jgi:hypothetical protein
VAIGWLWRDGANPVTTVTVRQHRERLRLWLPSVLWTLIVAGCVAVRVYPSVAPLTCLGASLFFLGLALAAASQFGALTGGSITIATAFAGFLLAPTGPIGQWPYNQAHAIAITMIGSSTFGIGTALAFLQGFDNRRRSRGRVIGINDN